MGTTTITGGRGGVCVAAAVAAATILTGTTTADAVGTTEIRPAALPRGAAPQVLHINDRTEVVRTGDRRIRLSVPGKAQEIERLSRNRFLLTSWVPRTGSHWVTVHRANGERRVLTRDADGEPALSPDRERVAFARLSRGRPTTVVVKGVRGGDTVARRRFATFTEVVGFRRRVLLAQFRPSRTLTWSPRTGATDVFRRGATAYAADADANQVALLVFPPGHRATGCTKVVTWSNPRRVDWRNCSIAVTSWSPNSNRILAVPILTDGYAASRWMVAHANTGRVTRAFSGTLMSAVFERAHHVLLSAENSRHRRGAVVRCPVVRGACERASKVYRIREAGPKVPLVLAETR